MGSITIQKFGGLVPRTSPRLLGNGDATQAIMTKLWSGELRPILDVLYLDRVALPQGAPILTLYLLFDKWLAWQTDVNVVTGFTVLSGAGHIYFTGDGPPKQTLYNYVRYGPATPLPATTYPIGVIGPTNFPTVAVTGAPGGDPIVRDYVYTFYTSFNEESAPSLPSALVTVETGQSVVLSGFDTATGTVQEARIYRTVGGNYTYVATISAPFPASYIDSATDLDIVGNESLQSQHYYPPPSDIQGLIGLACGSLAAFHGNSVVFSEPYQPGAWPPEYEKIFDYPIVALGTFGQTCVVATTGYTYLISGNDPRSFSVARVPDPYPCVSKRSMVSADNGVIYASSDGLIFVGTPTYLSGYAGVHVLTRELMTHDEWQAYNPSTIHGVIFDGRYYGFHLPHRLDVLGETFGFVFDFSSREKALVTGAVSDAAEVDKKDILSNLDFYASATFANPQVLLHLAINNKLYKWEGGSTYRALTWRSKQFSFPYAVTFSAVKVIASDYPQDIVLTVPPTLATSGPGVGIPFTRSYIYTFQTGANTESLPSPASLISVFPGDFVLFVGWQTPAPGIFGINIFRLVDGVYKYVSTITDPLAPYVDSQTDADIMGNRTFQLPATLQFSVLDGVTGNVLYSRSVVSAKPFRLPSLRGRTEWLFELTGAAAVQLIEISSAYQDLSERKVA